MVAPANPPLPANPGAPLPAGSGRPWYVDDLIVAAFAFLGVLGAVFLPVFLSIPPLVISFLLATGLAALSYKYLGGISAGTTYAVGALKLTGALAALVGIAFAVNAVLASQMQFRLLSNEDIIGPWKWVYGRGASSGHIQIDKDVNGNLIFTGSQEKYTTENSFVRLYTLTNGKAKLVNRNSLLMEADVEDHLNHAKFHWKSDAPIPLVPAFRGTMRAILPDGTEIPNTWGIMFYKQSGD